MSRPDYAEKIPNNVGLAEDRRLQRALESWQPDFLSWWESMGPALPTQDVYLRTAIDVRGEGWARFGHVPMIDAPELVATTILEWSAPALPEGRSA